MEDFAAMNTKVSSAQTVTFQAKDGLTVTAISIDGRSLGSVSLLCHQAGYSRGEYLEIAPKLNKLGYNCLAIDQRSGRGVNGVTNETNKAAQSAGLSVGYVAAYPDLEAALGYLIEQYHPKQLIAWGSSYSASLVLILAAEHPNDVQAVLSFSPGEYFSFNDQHIKDYAKKITQPVFITSSKSEAPAWRDIASAISSKGCVFFVPQGSGVHGSSALMEKTKNNAEYWTAVEDFLKSLQQS